jgi:hypothetical protein
MKSRYSDFDPDIHVAPVGQHVAEVRLEYAPRIFVPLTAAGRDLIAGKIAKGGPVYSTWLLTDYHPTSPA